MKIKCLQKYCRKQIKLTKKEEKEYLEMAKRGFIVSKFCKKHELQHKVSYDVAYEEIDKAGLREELKSSVLDPVSFLFRKWNNENYGIDKIDKFKQTVIQRMKEEKKC